MKYVKLNVHNYLDYENLNLVLYKGRFAGRWQKCPVKNNVT